MWIIQVGVMIPNPSTCEEDPQLVAQTYTHPPSLVPRLSMADITWPVPNFMLPMASQWRSFEHC
jgi:hypothetical protein